jgi:hypothetical protein
MPNEVGLDARRHYIHKRQEEKKLLKILLFAKNNKDEKGVLYQAWRRYSRLDGVRCPKQADLLIKGVKRSERHDSWR